MENNNKYLIIYHNEDNDGLFSGAMIYNYLIDEHHANKENITLFGADYATLSDMTNTIIDGWHEENKYDIVIMTDISFDKQNLMKHLYDVYGNNFIWFDHHKPIIKSSYSKKFSEAQGIRDTTRSAILCVYKFLYDPFDVKYKENTIPQIYRILSAWDSFSYKENGYTLDYVRDVNKGVTYKYCLNFNMICGFVNRIKFEEFTDGEIPSFEMSDFENIGKMLNEYDDYNAECIIKKYGDISWKVDGRNAIAVFIQGATNSVLFKCLQNSPILNAIVFKQSINDNWIISLYNINENDSFKCGEYLKEKYNGGGHAGAAGCSVSKSKFIKLLNSKEL